MNRTTISGTSRLLDDWNSDTYTTLLPSFVLHIVYVVVGVIGNSIVIYIHTFRMKSNKDDRFYIPILAFVDLITCICSTSFGLALIVLNVKFTDDSACEIVFFLSTVFVCMSALMLLAIAVERFRKICKPFSKQITIFWKKITVGVVVVVSIVSNLTCFLVYGVVEVYDVTRNITGHECGELTDPESQLMVLVFSAVGLMVIVILFVSLVILYILIGRVIWKQIRFQNRLTRSKTSASIPQSTKSTESSQTTSLNNIHGSSSDNYPDELENKESYLGTDNRRTSHVDQISAISTDSKLGASSSARPPQTIPGVRVTLMFMLITLVFIICYVPRGILLILDTQIDNFYENLSQTTSGFVQILHGVVIINNVINPIIYGFFDSRFRREAGRLFCRCYGTSRC